MLSSLLTLVRDTDGGSRPVSWSVPAARNASARTSPPRIWPPKVNLNPVLSSKTIKESRPNCSVVAESLLAIGCFSTCVPAAEDKPLVVVGVLLVLPGGFHG